MALKEWMAIYINYFILYFQFRLLHRKRISKCSVLAGTGSITVNPVVKEGDGCAQPTTERGAWLKCTLMEKKYLKSLMNTITNLITLKDVAVIFITLAIHRQHNL